MNVAFRIGAGPSHVIRLLLAPWLLGLLLLNSEFRTQLVTTLTRGEVMMPPRTFNELARRLDYSINLNGANETSSSIRFLALRRTKSLVSRIIERISKHSKLSETVSIDIKYKRLIRHYINVSFNFCRTRASLRHKTTKYHQFALGHKLYSNVLLSPNC